MSPAIEDFNGELAAPWPLAADAAADEDPKKRGDEDGGFIPFCVLRLLGVDIFRIPRCGQLALQAMSALQAQIMRSRAPSPKRVLTRAVRVKWSSFGLALLNCQ